MRMNLKTTRFTHPANDRRPASIALCEEGSRAPGTEDAF
jgi:hypothetical protein